MNPVIISLGLFKESGGPVKTIDKFREALNADLFCFADSVRVQSDRLANKSAKLVPTSRLPVLKQFCYSPKRYRTIVEEAAEMATILSCHSFYRYHTLWTHQVHKRFGTPYWNVPHGALDPYVLAKNSLAKRTFLAAGGERYLKNASCTIFATQREKEKAESVFGDLRGEVLNWPVELLHRKISSVERSEIRRKWGISDDAKILLFFGRLHSMKRPLETIQAVAANGDANTYLVILGPEEGVTRRDCEIEAKRLGFRNLRVRGPVFGDKKIEYLQACDAYVSLSHRENFNHCAAESLAAGLPVLLSKGNDLGEEVESAGAGYYLQSDTMKAWNEGLVKIMAQTPDQLRNMGKLGRDLVKEKFSFENFKSRLIELENRYGRK